MSESQVVVFKLNEQYFTLNITDIKEIVRYTKPTLIPNAPNYMEGIINMRGEVIPILNLAKRIDIPSIETSESTRIIVIDRDDKKIGLVVDEVSEVGKVNENSIQPASDFVMDNNLNDDTLLGVIKTENNLWLMLNLDEIIN